MTLRTTATVVPRYLGLVVAPVSLSAFHDVPLRTSWLEPAIMGSLNVILGLVAAAMVLIARGSRGAFWIAWFGLTLLPMLNLVPFPALMADRYLYVPLLGPLVLLAWAARALAGRALPAVAGGAVAACVWLTVARVPVFHSDLTLTADWLLRSAYIAPDTPNPGGVPIPNEISLLDEALAHDPDSAVLHNNLGAIAYEQGRIADAVAELERARALAPSDGTIALNLGRAYLHARRPELAVRMLEDARRLRPHSYYAHLNLGRAYPALGDAAGAREETERARDIGPEFW